LSRGSQHSAAKRRKEKERQAKQAAKRERRLHKGAAGDETAAAANEALVREYLGLPMDQDEAVDPEAEKAGQEDGSTEPTGGETAS